MQNKLPPPLEELGRRNAGLPRERGYRKTTQQQWQARRARGRKGARARGREGARARCCGGCCVAHGNVRVRRGVTSQKEAERLRQLTDPLGPQFGRPNASAGNMSKPDRFVTQTVSFNGSASRSWYHRRKGRGLFVAGGARQMHQWKCKAWDTQNNKKRRSGRWWKEILVNTRG